LFIENKINFQVGLVEMYNSNRIDSKRW